MGIRSYLLDTARKFLPPLSSTEKEALESGTVGWDAGLFSGKPDWAALSKIKKSELTQEEKDFIEGPVNELCAMTDTREVNELNDLPPKVWKFMKDKGFFGLEMSKDVGGLGFSSTAHAAIIMKLASRDVTLAVTTMVPNSLGPAKLIKSYGTKEQKEYYLPRLASGEEIPCFALTGPNAGSDAGSMPDTGVVCKNEAGVLGIKMNFDKRYITLAPMATLAGVAFNMKDPDGLLGDKKDIGITVALVPSGTEGFTQGDRHHPMDLAFQNGTLKGEDVFVPLESIIGGKEQAGNGWKMLMESLAIGRGISLPSLSVAGSKLSSFASGSYSRVRQQFGTDISNFEGIEEKLANIAGETYMMEASLATTLQMIDNGESPTVPSAALKYHLTEKLRKNINDTMDIHGGKAISDGPNNYLIDTYKGIPIAITVEGANIMTRNLIIFGQGLVRSHPYLLKEMDALAMEDTKSAFKVFTKLIVKHGFHMLKNTVKSLWYGLGGKGGRVPVKDKNTKKYYKQINRLSANLAIIADVTATTMGGELKRKERLSARLGDVYSNMYFASCVLRQHEAKGRPKEELPLLHWACTKLMYDAEVAMEDALANHPMKFLGRMLHHTVFPSGSQYKKVTDKMDKKVAKLITEDGSVRDSLAKAGIYIPKSNKNNPLSKLDDAFDKRVKSVVFERKIRKAMRAGELDKTASLADAFNKSIITESELKAIEATNKARDLVVAVDSFAPVVKKTKRPKRPKAA